MLPSLPVEVLQHLASFLSAQAILALLSAHPSIHDPLNGSVRFWNGLIHRDNSSSVSGEHPLSTTWRRTSDDYRHNYNDAVKAKKAFLVQSHASELVKIHWCSLSSTSSRTPSPREGHIMCVLGKKRILLHGGFCDDDNVQMLDVTSPATSRLTRTDVTTSSQERRKWVTLQSSVRSSSQGSSGGDSTTRPASVPFVYGSTLTAIDDRRAVRFGGFESGGYTSECNSVCVLHLEDRQEEQQQQPVVSWEPKTIHSAFGSSPPAPRAYHSATLIHNRYILYLGGMSARDSMLEPAILDTQSWSWLDVQVFSPSMVLPSSRHGHSVVLDECRDRLLLFGGGNGSDLLRSGVDNSQVWELKMPAKIWKTDFENSFPWTWRLVHRDQRDLQEDTTSCVSPGLRLSRTEAFCLGREHVCHRVSRDKVVLCFGSGHPTTNGLIGYDLKSDTFVRPKLTGARPIGRFSPASTFHDGWIVLHGGYTSTDASALGDVVVIDVAPGLRREFPYLDLEDADEEDQPLLPVFGARRGPGGGDASGDDSSTADDCSSTTLRLDATEMIAALMQVADPQEQQLQARRMTARLTATRSMTEQAAAILSMMTNGDGRAQFAITVDDDDDDDYDDNESKVGVDDDDSDWMSD